jgi:hypothetical protein
VSIVLVFYNDVRLPVFLYGLFYHELVVYHHERCKDQNIAVVQGSNCQCGGVHYILYVLFEGCVALSFGGLPYYNDRVLATILYLPFQFGVFYRKHDYHHGQREMIITPLATR